MEKGFVLTNMDQQWCVIVPYVTNVAKIIGKDRRTVTKWMTENRMYIHQHWMIVKGYDFVKRKPNDSF